MAAALAVAGCGGTKDFANDPRPPGPINISAGISDKRVTVSPAVFGAGPVTVLIANLTDDTQKLTVESKDSSTKSGIRQTSSAINPEGTSSLKVEFSPGRYMVSVGSRKIRTAGIRVGTERGSAQDKLLQP